MNIIYPPTIEWEGSAVYQRPQQLLNAFAKLGHRAVFVEYGRNDRTDNRGGVELCGVNSVPLRMDGPTVLWVTHPPHFRLKEQWQADLVVFDYIDEAVEEFAVWHNDDLNAAIQAADLVTVVSQRLYDLVTGQYPGKTVVLLPNAADYDFFHNAGTLAVPGDLAAIPRPVIGFYGSISTWIDTDFITALAGLRPDCSFVLIGPDYTKAASRLAGFPNVYFLGRKPYESLPAYAGHFDAAMIPFQVRKMTHSSSPIKMYEYLAAGIPVLASPILEAVHCPHVFTSDNPADWSAEIDRIMTGGSDADKAARQSYAAEHSWTARIHAVLEHLEPLASSKANGGMNSEAYWDLRFAQNWEAYRGREQTLFFVRVALGSIPLSIQTDIAARKLNVCDAGCALGDGTHLLAEAWPGCSFVGIDFAEAAVKRAKQLYPQHEFLRGDIGGFTERYDVVFVSNTLEHFYDPHPIIAHMLSKTNDYLIIMVPFQDDSGEPEHHYRFDKSDFAINRDSFHLIYAEAIDCNILPNSRWGGKQLVACYAHDRLVRPEQITLQSYSL
ncbi:methyltransferase domain-containing protein [Paenibacillus sp. GCM10012303]|uniref:methyltransferase domain-containing protein n=1 Tax=Paenibacillus sp. GCM10012303 TaxID=3317340 RepID=UPI00360F66BD